MEPTQPEIPENKVPLNQWTKEDRWLTNIHLQTLLNWLVGNNSQEKSFAQQVINWQKESGMLDALASLPGQDETSQNLAFKAKLLVNHLKEHPPTPKPPPENKRGLWQRIKRTFKQ